MRGHTKWSLEIGWPHREVVYACAPETASWQALKPKRRERFAAY